MAYSAAILVCLLLVPLLATLRGARPATLFLTAAAIYALFGVANFAKIKITLNQIQDAAPAYHDTYLIVRHGHMITNMGIAMAIIGAIIWVQTRLGAMRYPVLTKLLFWTLHISLIAGMSIRGPLAHMLPQPRKYIDYPEFMETAAMMTSLLGTLSQTALVGLLGLLMWSGVAKWLGK